MMTPEEPETATLLQEIAPTGQLRFALNHGNVVLVRRESSALGSTGISVDLAREFCRRLALAPMFIDYERAGDVSSSVAADKWDVCFLAIDPLRAREISFTAPYVAIDGNYLVSSHSGVATPHDVNRLGLKVGVTKGSAYALHLLREAKGARIVEFNTYEDVKAALQKGSVEAVAGVRQAMVQLLTDHPNLRLVDEPFMSIEQAIGIKSGKHQAFSFANSLIAELKASGFVANAIERHGHSGLRIPS